MALARRHCLLAMRFQVVQIGMPLKNFHRLSAICSQRGRYLTHQEICLLKYRKLNRPRLIWRPGKRAEKKKGIKNKLFVL